MLLIAGHFLQALGFSSMLLLPMYLDRLGANRAEIGSIMAAGSIGGLLSRPLVGWALDTVGRRPTLIAGTVSLSAGMWLVAAVTGLGPLVYLERIVFGVGQGALFTAYFTFAADIVPSARRTEGIALFGVSGMMPLLVNPFSTELGIGAGELRWFLPLVGVAVALSILPVLRLREPPRPASAERVTVAAIWRSLRDRPLFPVWLATAAFSGVVAVFMTFATVSADKRGLPTPTIMWVGYPLAAASVRLLGARLPDRVGPHNVVAPAMASYAFALIVAASAQTTTGFLVAGLLGGIGHGYCFPVLIGQVVSRVPEQHRGSGLAMFTALWGLSEVALPPLAGAFADGFGDSAMFTLTALVVGVAVAAWAALERRFGGDQNVP